jgi:hypothetical protein
MLDTSKITWEREPWYRCWYVETAAVVAQQSHCMAGTQGSGEDAAFQVSTF